MRCSGLGVPGRRIREESFAVRVDPITVEVVRCALKAAANDLLVVLKLTAYNMMIYEVQDYCVSIVDYEGLTMSQNEGALPIFLADLGVAVQDGVEIYGLKNIHPGDVFLVNHPEICGQHLNNMVVYTPFSGTASCSASWQCGRIGSTSAAAAPASARAILAMFKRKG